MLTTPKFGYIGPIHLPCDWGTPEVKDLRLDLYERDGFRYLTARLGPISPDTTTLVRVQSACALADFFHSRWCDCAWQFAEAKRRVFDHGSGVVIYCYDQHGKGVGLRDHYRIYTEGQKHKDKNLLVETFNRLGLAYENRRYDHVIDILREIGVGKMRLMTNDPERLKTFAEGGFEVEREALIPPADEYNWEELDIKRDDFGHMV